LQVYTHEITGAAGYSRLVDPEKLVLVGFDLMEENPRDLMIYFTADEMRIGVLYSGRWSWQIRSHELFTLFLLCVIAGVYILRPLAVDVDSPLERNVIVKINMLGSTVIILVMFYHTVEIYEGVERSTGFDSAAAAVLTAGAMSAMLVKYAALLYANLAVSSVSPVRTAIVRLCFPSMLSVVFIMYNCGATERDIQV